MKYVAQAALKQSRECYFQPQFLHFGSPTQKNCHFVSRNGANAMRNYVITTLVEVTLTPFSTSESSNTYRRYPFSFRSYFIKKYETAIFDQTIN